MERNFSPRPSDEDLELYLVGKATPNLIAMIEEHYFGYAPVAYPNAALKNPRPLRHVRWETAAIAATVTFMVMMSSMRVVHHEPAPIIGSDMAILTLPFAPAIAASASLYAPPEVVPAVASVVRSGRPAAPKIYRLFQPPPKRPHALVRIALADAPALVPMQRAIPELPFEPDTPQVVGPPKARRLRRVLTGITTPLRLLLSLDKFNRGA